MAMAMAMGGSLLTNIILYYMTFKSSASTKASTKKGGAYIKPPKISSIGPVEKGIPISTQGWCIPGFICIENFTFGIVLVLVFMVGYLYYATFYKQTLSPQNSHIGQITGYQTPPVTVAISTRNSPEYDGPPLRNDGAYFPRDSGDIRGGIPIAVPALGGSQDIYIGQGGGQGSGGAWGIPINVQTRGANMAYSQIGILTRTKDMTDREMILPLMGRKLTIGLDKWQYYTVSNSGVVNTRLPIRFKGRSCTSDQGCDYLNSGDMVYVEGYDDTFRATIYENTQFQYIPYI
jgi:hypothetical protein